MATRFVCVHNRNRDSYQVPLALAEAGLLEALVTDYYAPDDPPAWLPAFLRRRRVPGLPRKFAKLDRLGFVIQYAAELLRMPMGRVFPVTDRMLARTAGRLAAKSGSAIYAYHHYIPDKLSDDVPLVVFVFHPLARDELPILEEDASRFPESRRHLEEARKAQVELRKPIDWSRVDAVVCASGFTARSVIADGCDASKIKIIPYGLPDLTTAPDKVQARRQPGDGARFLFVGQGVARKWLHHLIRAWQAQPPDNATLEIVCYRIDPDIAALVTHPSIRLSGRLTREELDRRLAQADVFAMPSLVEGFGLVYLEALAAGCHVLGTANTGLPDTRLDDAALTLVPPGDLEQLSDALTRLAKRAKNGEFDRQGIAEAASGWTQSAFRKGIAAHAAEVLRSAGAKGG